jgi:hypothetical protein
MNDIDCESIVLDVEARVGYGVANTTLSRRNGYTLKFHAWQELPSPWSEVYVEATPEKRKGLGYSVHLDFVEGYTEAKASDDLRSARQRLVCALEAGRSRAALIIGQEFSIDPRAKRHFLVEQDQVVLYDEWGRDAKIAELIAHYITAFDPAIRTAAGD